MPQGIEESKMAPKGGPVEPKGVRRILSLGTKAPEPEAKRPSESREDAPKAGSNSNIPYTSYSKPTVDDPVCLLIPTSFFYAFFNLIFNTLIL